MWVFVFCMGQKDFVMVFNRLLISCAMKCESKFRMGCGGCLGVYGQKYNVLSIAASRAWGEWNSY